MGFFGNFAGVGFVWQHGKSQCIRQAEQCIGLGSIISEIVDHDRKLWPPRGRNRGCFLRLHEWSNQMDQLNPSAVHQVIEALKSGRTRPFHSLQMVIYRHAPELRFDLPAGASRILQGAEGYLATIVAGRVTRRDDLDTGERSGRLVRAGR